MTTSTSARARAYASALLQSASSSPSSSDCLSSKAGAAPAALPASAPSPQPPPPLLPPSSGARGWRKRRTTATRTRAEEEAVLAAANLLGQQSRLYAHLLTLPRCHALLAALIVVRANPYLLRDPDRFKPLSDVLWCGIDWRSTPEGRDFWYPLVEELESLEDKDRARGPQ